MVLSPAVCGVYVVIVCLLRPVNNPHGGFVNVLFTTPRDGLRCVHTNHAFLLGTVYACSVHELSL